MTPKVIWSVFALILFGIFVRTDTSLPTYQRGNKIEDRVVQQTKSLVSSKGSKKFQDKIPRFGSKKLKNPTLFGKTSQNDGNLLMFLSSLAHKKHGWKKYLEHHIKCDDTPTQPPLSTQSPSSLQLVPSVPLFQPTNLLYAPTLDPSISNFPSSSTLPSLLPSTTTNPSNEVSHHTFNWKIETDDIDRVFATKDQIAKKFEKFLDHHLRCKKPLIKHIKLIRDQEEKELYMKGVCFGSRESCNINLSEDDCNDNRLIDLFVAQKMSEISSSFDYEIDLSVSFNFDSDDISVVPDFLSEIIEGTSGARKAVDNSKGLKELKELEEPEELEEKPKLEPHEPSEVNNEVTLTIEKDAAKSNFQNEAMFQQYAIEFNEVIFLSTEDFSFTEFTSSDDTTRDSLYYGTPKRKCGSKCVEEKITLEKIFAFYDLNFNTSIDVCFWDSINCIDGYVTQIFFRKY